MPVYAAYGKDALPPPTGYELIKDALNVLTDDIANLKSEIVILKAQKSENIQEDIQKSITDMKRVLTLQLETKFAEFQRELNSASISQNGISDKNTSVTLARTQPEDQSQYRLQYRDSVPEEIFSRRNYAEAAKSVATNPTVKHTSLPMKTVNSVQMPKNQTAKSEKPKHAEKLRTKSRNPVIRGTKTVTVHSKPLGAVRYADLFVGGCYKNVVANDIKEYCTNVLNVDIEECVPLVTKSTRFSSFKLTLERENREKLLDGNCWPKNVVIRKFTQPRGASSTDFSLNKQNIDVGSVSQNGEKNGN